MLGWRTGERRAAAEVIAPFQQGFAAWADVPAVVVAAVQGHAIGAGFQLALAADLRVVADDVQLAMRETSLGLVPDLGGTGPLVALVGWRGPWRSAPRAASSAPRRRWPAGWPPSPCPVERARGHHSRPGGGPPRGARERPCASSSRCCARRARPTGTPSCASSARPRVGCCTGWRLRAPGPERPRCRWPGAGLVLSAPPRESPVAQRC